MDPELVLKLATALVALVGAIATILKVFDIRSQNEKMANVGRQFAEVVDALATDNEVKRRSGAILLRRFFDPGTESGVAGTPYADEALGVIASLLRGEETGVCQKLLADGLAYALSLRNADLQQTNLTQAYLGDRIRPPVDISGADFFEACLDGASLNGAIAKGTVFYGAQMNGTRLERASLEAANFAGAALVGARLRGAVLDGADFTGANLENARFDGASLDGAVFAGAANVPDAIRAHLDAAGVHRAA